MFKLLIYEILLIYLKVAHLVNVKIQKMRNKKKQFQSSRNFIILV